jgi:hypothetical protein
MGQQHRFSCDAFTQCGSGSSRWWVGMRLDHGLLKNTSLLSPQPRRRTILGRRDDPTMQLLFLELPYLNGCQVCMVRSHPLCVSAAAAKE